MSSFPAIADVLSLEDLRICPARLEILDDRHFLLHMDDMTEHGWRDLGGDFPEIEWEPFDTWRKELYDDMISIGIVCNDLHTGNVMVKDDEYILIDHEQFVYYGSHDDTRFEYIEGVIQMTKDKQNEYRNMPRRQQV